MSRFSITLSAISLSILLSALSGCSWLGRSPIATVDGTPETSGDRILGDLAGVSLLGSEESDQTEPPLGLYTITPFDPSKIPVVLVHGDSPHTTSWDMVLRRFSEDQQIREHYQFWKFLYPTDTSYLKSASDLRVGLDDALNQLDRKRENPNLSKIVLIGHGLGGLIAKLQISHSDDKLSVAVSNKAIEGLELSADAREMMRSTLQFEPHPMIRKVIAIGSPTEPYGDSQPVTDLIENPLTQLSGTIREGFQKIVSNRDELLIDTTTGVPITEDQLNVDSPIWQATNQLRLTSTSQMHSISDDVYQYQTDEAINEIKNILFTYR